MNPDVLVHEATLTKEERSEAFDRGHSSTGFFYFLFFILVQNSAIFTMNRHGWRICQKNSSQKPFADSF